MDLRQHRLESNARAATSYRSSSVQHSQESAALSPLTAREHDPVSYLARLYSFSPNLESKGAFDPCGPRQFELATPAHMLAALDLNKRVKDVENVIMP